MRARPVFRGTTLLLTRRVRGRVFLLRPSKKTNNIVGYVLAYVANKHGIRIHAVKVLSNHWHLVVTDPEGAIVEFQRDCHSLIGRALNAAHGDFESVWSSQPTSRVECAEAKDTVGKIAYTMANAVKAGLVRHGKSWPGLRLAWPQRPRVYKRPRALFSDDMPSEVVLELHRPPGYEELSDVELGEIVQHAIDDAEGKARAKADRAKRRFLGRKAVLAQSRYACPTTREPRFGMRPRVAARDKWRRIEMIGRNRAWDESYDAALSSWRAGDREALFPYGTYKMRVLHGARCADPPT